MQIDVIFELLTNYQTKRDNVQIEINAFSSGEDLLKNLNLGIEYDIMLIDILMPGIDGIELAKEIRKKDDNVILIFITATEDFAIEAFKVYASNYIVKPVIEEDMFSILDRFIPLIKKGAELYLTLSMSERTVKIPFSSIVSVELLNRRPCVYLDNGKILTGKFLRGNFNDFIKPLLKDERFFHAHKSYAVNISFAMELTGDSLIMKSDMVIPVTKRNYAEAKRRYLSYHSKVSPNITDI